MLPLLTAAASAIVGGEETDGWPAVVGLYASVGGQPGDAFCSGTLITPDAVLTCAHCVDRLLEHQAGSADTYVIVGTSARGGIDTFAQVVETVQYPEWQPNPDNVDTAVGSDIALLRLAEPVDGVEPIELNAEPIDASWIGLELDVVGWGATTAELVDGGVKRHVTVPITGLEQDLWLVTGEAGLGRNACYGDSGGAVLRTFDDGVTRLVAMPAVAWWHAGAADACVDGWGWDLRVDTRRAFIDETLAAWAAIDTGDTGAAVEPPDDPPAPATEGGAGCGCSTGRGAGFSWALWALALTGWLARSHSARHRPPARARR